MNLSTEHFLHFARNFPEPHLLVSREGVILAANPAFETILPEVASLPLTLHLQELAIESVEAIVSYLNRCSTSSQMTPGMLALRRNGSSILYYCEGTSVGPFEDERQLILLRLHAWDNFLMRFTQVNKRVEEMKSELENRIHIEEQLDAERLNLQRRIEYVEAVYKITSSLFRAETLDHIYEEALDAICKTLRTDRCAVLLFDQQGVMRFRAWRGLSDEYRDAVEGHSPWKQGEKNAQPVVIDNIQQTFGDSEELKQTVLKEGIHAMAFVPLCDHDQLLGKFMVYYDNPHPFNEEELRLIQTVSGHVGLAIQRKKTEEDLKSSLEEKQILLQEIHHRVKNNMQVVSSLLSLQAKRVKDQQVLRMFEESRNRVNTMALIHESLYRSKDLSVVRFRDYLQTLASELFRFYGVSRERIRMHLACDDLWMSINTAVPLGLILNELISNALKHAFPGDRDGEIHITLRANGDIHATLIFSDTGIGLPDGFDISNATTLGLRLVNILATQVDGEVAYESGPGGTKLTISFSRS